MRALTIHRILAAGLLFCTTIRADEIDRLLNLGKVWYDIKLFHPYLAYSHTNWDQALVAVIPAVRSARTPAEYAAAVQELLDTLQDPLTGVVPPASSVGGQWYQVKTDGGTAVVTLSPGRNTNPNVNEQDIPALTRSITAASAAVFDLRSQPQELSAARRLAGMLDTVIQQSCVSSAIRLTFLRVRARSGLLLQMGDFHVTQDFGEAPGPGARERPIVFIANRNSVLPRSAPILQKSGQAAVVFVGEGAAVVNALVEDVPLEAGYRVQLRTAEAIDADGVGIGEPSVRAASESAVALALEYARKPQHFAFKAQPLPAVPNVPMFEQAYPSMRYPAAEYRLLAAFRLCGALQYFYAYPHLQDRPLGDVCRAHLPAFLAASNELEYHLAAARMLAEVNDSHVNIRSPVLDKYFGTARPPLELRWIEGKAVVGQVGENITGIHPGDIVLRIDGEDVAGRVERLRYLTAGSTPHSRIYRILQLALMGAEGSPLVIEVTGPDGGVHTVQVPRGRARPRQAAERRGGVVRLLADGIGYVDLDRLEPGDVDAMFEKLRDARAIIFDMRGYPQETMTIAARLTDRDQVPAALFSWPAWHEPMEGKSGRNRTERVQTLLPTDKWRYKGQTIMLLDERAISQSEHTALWFFAANGTKFVGSASAGADGTVITTLLPGAISVRFSGQEIRHPDGQQLQRVGILPDVPVTPTIAGLRAGRDEVLDRAVSFVLSRK
jgi:C-terminal processing protease CtpA/Prc